MKWILQLLALSALVVAGTWLAGWFMVPVLGAAYGAWAVGDRRAGMTAALAGVVGWGALLAYDRMIGPAGELARLFGGVIHLSGPALIVLTLCYAALLCASAASTARVLRQMVG